MKKTGIGKAEKGGEGPRTHATTSDRVYFVPMTKDCQYCKALRFHFDTTKELLGSTIESRNIQVPCPLLHLELRWSKLVAENTYLYLRE